MGTIVHTKTFRFIVVIIKSFSVGGNLSVKLRIFRNVSILN